MSPTEGSKCCCCLRWLPGWPSKFSGTALVQIGVFLISLYVFRERLRKHRNELDDSDEQIVLNLLNEIIGNYYAPEKPVPQTRTVLYVLDSHRVTYWFA